LGSGWYYLANDTRIGPVEQIEIDRLVSQGSILANTLVWREGLDGWEEAGNQFSFVGGVSGPPPVPPRARAASMVMSTPAKLSAGYEQGSSVDKLYAGAPARGFGEAISTCLSKYFTFSGRASRSEYWFFFLFSFLISLVATILDTALVGIERDTSPLNALAMLGLFLPGLAAGVRRIHDINRSGWWYGSIFFWFLGLTIAGILHAVYQQSAENFIGFSFFAIILGFIIHLIVLLAFLCRRGDTGPNRFD
jgi:uncharacterized membrane protein YhaH (DUF805 family)